MDRITTFKRFLEEHPQDSLTRYSLAMEYANAGNSDMALEEFGKLIQINPDYTPAYHMAAQTLVREGRDDQARKMLEQGIGCARRTGNLHAQREMEGLLESLDSL